MVPKQVLSCRIDYRGEVKNFFLGGILFSVLSISGCTLEVIPSTVDCPEKVCYENGNCYRTFQVEGEIHETGESVFQCWMKENLNEGIMIPHDQVPRGAEIEKYCLDNDLKNCEEMGALYDWDELMNNSSLSGAQGICPNGWHIPTDDDWKRFEKYLGLLEASVHEAEWRGTVVKEDELKDTSKFHMTMGKGHISYDQVEKTFTQRSEDAYRARSILWLSTKSTYTSPFVREIAESQSGQIKRTTDTGFGGVGQRHYARCIKD